MYVVIWRFTTRDPAAFERHYGPEGTWARFFRRSPDYIRTDLVKDGDVYLTLDWWISAAAYDAFRADHADEYARIDASCEAVTASEAALGRGELRTDAGSAR